MALNNKTSANLVAVLTIEDIAPAGIELSQFSTDAGVVAEAVQEVQAEMTLDGHLVVGYTPNPQVVSITLQPTSPSLIYLREMMQAQRSRRTPLKVGLTVAYPSTGQTFSFENGVLSSGQAMPAGNRVQDPVTLQFTFESVK